MVALVDYGIGNLRSVEKALSTVGAKVVLTSEPGVILSADQVVLPGVGAFGDGMNHLHLMGLVDVILGVVNRQIPLLGICLGMQLLFESSDELGDHQGLGLLGGRVTRFPDKRLKVPHTGWNQIDIPREVPLLSGVQTGDYAYFNHSYYCEPTRLEEIVAQTEYGLSFPSVVAEGRIYGVQFHPEKSQAVGLKILRNFVELCK